MSRLEITDNEKKIFDDRFRLELDRMVIEECPFSDIRRIESFVIQQISILASQMKEYSSVRFVDLILMLYEYYASTTNAIIMRAL